MLSKEHPLIPKHKFDLKTAQAAVDAGYPIVEPILPQLIEWLQDINWPVARVLAPFLASIGLPLVPHLDKVISSNDHIWQYWIIISVIGENSALFQHYKTST